MKKSILLVLFFVTTFFCFSQTEELETLILKKGGSEFTVPGMMWGYTLNYGTKVLKVDHVFNPPKKEEIIMVRTSKKDAKIGEYIELYSVKRVNGKTIEYQKAIMGKGSVSVTKKDFDAAIKNIQQEIK